MKSFVWSHFILACLLTLALLTVGGCGQTEPTAAPASTEVPFSYEELAHRYAPIIYQGAATDQD